MSSVLISNRVNIIKYNTYKHKFSGVPNKFKGIRCPETKASEDRCDREQRQGMARGAREGPAITLLHYFQILVNIS